jgi:hypothetical protein
MHWFLSLWPRSPREKEDRAGRRDLGREARTAALLTRPLKNNSTDLVDKRLAAKRCSNAAKRWRVNQG